MMYQNKLVTCIKVNGQILREQPGGVVLLPFGAEYSVLVKNLNPRRAKVKIAVDGVDATSDTWLVIGPNQSLDLERFIANGNWQAGNRFKFIERTGGIEAHRGIKADDGLVRVEFAVEKRIADQPIVHYTVPQPYYWPCYPPYDRRRQTMMGSALRKSSTADGGMLRSSNFVSAASMFNVGESGVESFTPTCTEQSLGGTGITVAGSVSQQSFMPVADFPVDASDVIVLTLRGVVAGKGVRKAVTVKTAAKCATCGKSVKGAQFCGTCGTAARIV